MKSAFGLTGSGIRDWVVQRVSAVVLAFYTVVLLGWLIGHPDADYDAWRCFMLSTPMKITSLLALVSLVGHTWVGMWTVFTDYVTTHKLGSAASSLRFVLQSLMIVALLAYLVWGIAIFWAN